MKKKAKGEKDADRDAFNIKGQDGINEFYGEVTIRAGWCKVREYSGTGGGPDVRGADEADRTYDDRGERRFPWNRDEWLPE